MCWLVLSSIGLSIESHQVSTVIDPVYLQRRGSAEHSFNMHDQSKLPLLDVNDLESNKKTDVEINAIVSTEDAPINTQAFWLLIWMAK